MIESIGMIVIGGATCGVGTFMLLTGMGRPRVAAEYILVGVGSAMVGMGIGAVGAIGDALMYGGVAIGLGAGTMQFRRKRLEKKERQKQLRS